MMNGWMMDYKIPWTKYIQIKSGIGLPKSDNPEILSVIVTRQDICCLAPVHEMGSHAGDFKTPAQNCSVHELGTQSVLLLPIS